GSAIGTQTMLVQSFAFLNVMVAAAAFLPVQSAYAGHAKRNAAPTRPGRSLRMSRCPCGSYQRAAVMPTLLQNEKSICPFGAEQVGGGAVTVIVNGCVSVAPLPVGMARIVIGSLPALKAAATCSALPEIEYRAPGLEVSA